jgi:hypothetical protein
MAANLGALARAVLAFIPVTPPLGRAPMAAKMLQLHHDVVTGLCR